MKRFPYAHASHPQWRMAAALVLAQLQALMARPDHAASPTLALLYITDHYADDAQALLDLLSAELPMVTDWAGTVGIGIVANNAEYIDEPALAVMLCDLPADQYRVFSGIAPLGLGFEAHTALVHADAGTPDIAGLIGEMAGRTHSGYLFGGLASSRRRAVQFAVAGNGNLPGHGAAGGVFSGGLSGVAFGEGVPLVSRVTQGTLPVGPARELTAVDGHLLLALDGEPALDALLGDLGLPLDPSLARDGAALAALRATLAGLTEPGVDIVQRTGHFGSDVLVRHLIGLDIVRRGVAIGEQARVGQRVAFCQRNTQAARADLVRICTEIREAVEPAEPDVPMLAAQNEARGTPAAAQRPAHEGAAPARAMLGAVYISCTGRGGPHFGGPSAELQTVRRALGDVPLVGFFAGGEIARHHLYGYTGVLTVFTDR